MRLRFQELRAANATRTLRWYDPNSTTRWEHDDWLCAIGGEAGEALNAVKKLNRARLNMKGNAQSWDALVELLGSELADAAIYLDITLHMHRAPLLLGRSSSYVIDDFDALRRSTRNRHMFADPDLRLMSNAGKGLLRNIGLLAGLVPLTDDDMCDACGRVLSSLDAIAWHAGIDFGAAVVRTFNAKSQQLGFPERLAVPEEALA